jgi:hypothetical protein
MKELHTLNIDSSNHVFGKLPLSGGNEVHLQFSHWIGSPMDLDMEVSYDGGETWMYGGGCQGAVSAEDGIEFHFKYPGEPTHIKGSCRSEQNISSVAKIYSGE